VLDHLELKAESLVLQPQAVSLAVSEPEDRDLGIAIVDIGGITNISIFKDGVLRFYKTLPLGGENITKDISIGLRTPYKKAEEIKKLYGTATISCVEHDQPIIIEDISGRANKQISQRLLSSIIEPRVEEILQHVEMTLRNSCYVDGLSGGIILTGGTSMLKGIDLLAEQIFRLPVKIGTIRANGDAQSQLSDTNFTTAVGLIRYGLNGKDLYVKQSEGLFSIFALKIKELFA
jgi:cell division protein FtsA